MLEDIPLFPNMHQNVMLSVMYYCIVSHPNTQWLKTTKICTFSTLWGMAIWMVLLLISPGVTHMTKSLCGSKEAQGTKMTSRTSDISCQLSARCLASSSSSSRLPFTAWWLQGFKRTKARGEGHLRTRLQNSQNIYWSNKSKGQPRFKGKERIGSISLWEEQQRLLIKGCGHGLPHQYIRVPNK